MSLQSSQSNGNFDAGPPSAWMEWYETKKERFSASCRALIDSPIFNGLTIVLTLYALFGDDTRMAATNKAMDVVFNIFTIFATVVFTIELVAACLGRDGYFLGFFFYLDFCSTFTLILDLTWVNEALMCGTGASMDTSRAGRAGARASRTVRVIRLLRLVKLYKMYEAEVERRKQKKLKEQQQLQKQEKAQQGDHDFYSEDEDDEHIHDFDEDHEGKENEAKSEDDANEMRVGKKLGDMTTRRVIILVLVMLFLVPQFSLGNNYILAMVELRDASSYGTSLLYERFRQWCPMEGKDGADIGVSDLPACLQEVPADSSNYSQRQLVTRKWYETYFLEHVYKFHDGGDNFFNRLYWIGLKSETLERAHQNDDVAAEETKKKLGRMAQLGQSHYLGSDGLHSTAEWDDHYASTETSRMELPRRAKEVLTSPWREECYGHVGVTVSGVSADVCSLTEFLRCSELEFVMPQGLTAAEARHLKMMFVFDKRRVTVLEAQLSMLQTVFICIAVGIGSVAFSHDASHLLLTPIGRMIAKMQNIVKSPLEAINMGDVEFRRTEIESAQRAEELAKKGRIMRILKSLERKPSQPMETVVLEKTIIKLGGILALGFGEEGANVVKAHLKGENAIDLNPKALATPMECIVGVAGIRDFDLLLKALHTRIGAFVNKVAEIVHSIGDEYNGAPNCNYGGTFVLLWRLTSPQEESLQKKMGDVTQDKESLHKKMADMAILSMMKMVAEIKKSAPLAAYHSHPAVIMHLGKHYCPRIDVGVHRGSTLECVVGSAYKLDVMYLSSTVKIAAQLASDAWRYGVHLLMTRDMFDSIGVATRTHCRAIDVVTLRDAKRPVRLYTLDLDTSVISVQTLGGTRAVRNRYRWRQLREEHLSEKLTSNYNPMHEFELDPELPTMRGLYSSDFYLRFDTGFRNYVGGQWRVARDMLITCRFSPDRCADSFVGIGQSQWPADGPTVALLQFMADHDNTPPEGWPGYRRL
eukprot:TRINITY_DN15759_c0_g2_i1.p1 TRINITY_DN15759_c0_g2~~TRINITY_DN15759_c0_g2_i1.p1  ORF type:complete len:983 (+),score=251.25 TRINITY_DN15759_c0_g2_i1:313-3261(+)